MKEEILYKALFEVLERLIETDTDIICSMCPHQLYCNKDVDSDFCCNFVITTLESKYQKEELIKKHLESEEKWVKSLD